MRKIKNFLTISDSVFQENLLMLTLQLKEKKIKEKKKEKKEVSFQVMRIINVYKIV